MQFRFIYHRAETWWAYFTGHITQTKVQVTGCHAVTTHKNLDSDELPDRESPEEFNTTSNSEVQSVHQTIISENEHPAGPPRKVRKVKMPTKESEEVQSKTAKALELILGKVPQVSEIDRLRKIVAKNPKAHFYRRKYDTLLSNVQTSVLRELSSVKRQLKQWDEDFLKTHGKIPNNNDYGSHSHFKELSKKKKVALKLLESWSITVHLL